MIVHRPTRETQEPIAEWRRHDRLSAAAQAGRIDELVYELYGLTDKEIRIVEDATARGG